MLLDLELVLKLVMLLMLFLDPLLNRHQQLLILQAGGLYKLLSQLLTLLVVLLDMGIDLAGSGPIQIVGQIPAESTIASHPLHRGRAWV